MSTKTLSVRVERIKQEACDIASFELVDPTGGPLPSFDPGAHVDVHIAPGLIRQYSLCNGPGVANRYWIAVKREPASRGGSAAMHERVKEGDLLTIGEPRNNFPLAADARQYLLIAGGIGITPILSMARHLQARGADFKLLYFCRSMDHAAFHEELSHERFGHRVHFHYALDPDATRAYLRRALWERPDGAQLYLCGPKPFMDTVEECASPHWPPDSVRLEYFNADPEALAGPSEEFEVELSRTGGVYTIPEGKSIVEVLGEHGVEIEVSCEQGICGTCLTGVVEGQPDHRDMYLSDEEREGGDKMTPCVSRAQGRRLVLDL